MMAEVMKSWSSAFRPTQPGPECQTGKDLLESVFGVPPEAGMHEEGRIFAVGEGGVARSGVTAQDLQRCAVKWNEPALAELALSDNEHSRFQVHIRMV